MERSAKSERMEQRRCVATASGTGERCRKAAIRGGTVCGTHGGSVGRVKGAAQRREAESAALAAYSRYSPNGDGQGVDVVAALTELAAEVRRFADWTGARVEAMTSAAWTPDDPRAAAEFGLYERALDRAGKLLADMGRLQLVHSAIVADVEARHEAAERARRKRSVEGSGQRFTASLRALLTELGHDPDDEWVGCLAGWAFLYRDNGAPLPPRPPDPAEFRTAPPSLYMTFGEAEDMRREHEARERWQA